MKLYNLYQEVILEESQRQLKLLSEAASGDVIKKAIDDRYEGWITYRDYDDGTPPSRRYIQTYVLGKTKAGNQAIRAYQLGGESVKTKERGWKTFRTDRIESFDLVNKKWHNPVSDYDKNIPPYNQLGDDSFVSIEAQVDPSKFNRQRSAIPKPVQQPQQPEEPEMLRRPEEPEQEPEKELSKPLVLKPKANKQPEGPGKRQDRVRTNRKPEEPQINVSTGKPRVTKHKPIKPIGPEIGNKEEEL